MQPTLMAFLFNTFQAQLNNQQNGRMWLPAALQGMTDGNGAKVLPLQAAQFCNAPVTGSSGVTFGQNIANAWYMIVTQGNTSPDVGDHMGVPCPATPEPNLALNAVTIAGLDNVYLEPSPTIDRIDTGYDLTIILQQGYYPATAPVSGTDIALTGTYVLTQCVCSTCKTGTPACVDVPVAIPDPIVGTGDVETDFEQMMLTMDVTLAIGGTGAGRGLVATVGNIVLTPPAANALTVQTLTLANGSSGIVTAMWANVYRPQTIRALTSSDGVAGLVAALQLSLNAPANLGSIGATLGGVMQTTLASAFGSIAPGSLVSTPPDPTTNPLDQYIFDYMVTALNQSTSNYYAPALILFSTNPVLDPYSLAAVDLGQTTIGSTTATVTLTSVQITGGSNVVVSPEATTLSGTTITATASLGTLDPPPTLTNPATGQPQTVPAPPLSLTADLSVQLANAPDPITGSIAVTLTQPALDATVDLAGDTVDTLTLTFTAIALAVTPANVAITLTMDSVFQAMVNNYLNQDATKQDLIAAINTAAAGNLAAISAAATQVAQAKINAAMGS